MITKLMGVINITPDSFSDGSQFNTQEKFSLKFNELLSWADIIDIGAESTAPMNEKVSSDIEIKRFRDVLFPFIENNIDPMIKISIDTYKIKVFKEVAAKLARFWPKCEVIFNDVSGKLDTELMEFLKTSELKFTYIYSHNLCLSRQETNKHMDYTLEIQEIEFVKSVVEYFIVGIDKLKGCGRNFYIDPCFGFSKTREQNHALLKYFKTFLLQMPYSITCLFGISKKSFLRFPIDLDLKDENSIKMLEQMQSIFIFDLVKESMQREVVFRVHDPICINSALNVKKILEN